MSRSPEWILASASPRRHALLSRWQPAFRVLVPEVEEWNPEEADPAEQVVENARRKGQVIAERHPEALVIAADTTVALGRRIFGKPADRETAVAMLRALSGRRHQVLTGMALYYEGRSLLFYETSHVCFHELDQVALEKYLSLVHVLDKAGAYAIQEHGDLIIDHYEGSFENIMGLPVQRLFEELVQLDWVATPPFKPDA